MKLRICWCHAVIMSLNEKSRNTVQTFAQISQHTPNFWVTSHKTSKGWPLPEVCWKLPTSHLAPMFRFLDFGATYMSHHFVRSGSAIRTGGKLLTFTPPSMLRLSDFKRLIWHCLFWRKTFDLAYMNVLVFFKAAFLALIVQMIVAHQPFR